MSVMLWTRAREQRERQERQRVTTEETLRRLREVADTLNETSGRLGVLLKILPNILDDEGGTDGTRGCADPGSEAPAAADRPRR